MLLGLSLTLEKLYPVIREVLIYIVPSTSTGKMGCGGWHGSACHRSLLTLGTQLPAAWSTDTPSSVSALHGQIQQFLWKSPLQERDWLWRYYFASVREGYFRLIPLKGKLQTNDCFSSHVAKSYLKQFAPEAEHIKDTPQLQPAAACWGKTTPAALDPCCRVTHCLSFIMMQVWFIHCLVIMSLIRDP